jgi:hypothetical protein
MSAPSPSFEDTSLFLRAPGGSLVAENDDCRSSRGFDSCIENFTLPATGTYTIEATSFSAEARGPYTLLAEKTSAADRPPTVTRVAAFGLTSTSAIITWLTDEPATGLVEFGVSCCAQRSTSETVLTLVHAIALDGLSPSTTYFFRVTSADAGGNPTVSEVFRFQTPADTVGPVISRIAVAGVTTGSAVVTWTTGEPATGEVEFGPAGLCPCPFRSPRASALSLDHSLALSGLTPNTRYFFRVLSADAAGNLTVTQGGSFTTADLKLTVGEVAGSVESRDSFGRLLSVSRGFSLPAGALIQTKSESEAKDVTTPDGARFVLSSETGATIGPPAGAPGGEFAAALVRGSVRFTSPAGLGGAAPTVGPQLAAAETPGTQRVRTPTVTVRARDAACAGTAAFTQTGMTGTTVIDVASGTCDVIDRLGRVTTLVAGTQRSFADVVPRVSLVLPADHGNVRRTESGAVPFKNALVWTAFPGAAGYLIEYAVAPAEAFTTANARAVERPANTVQVMSGPGGVTIRLPGMSAPIPVGAETNSFVSYSESAGLVQLDLMLGTPSGTQALWRIFPLDASGAVLAGTEGSDAFLAFVE